MDSLFYTDDISYIVGIHKNLSWIWKKENISLENIKEIVKILKNKNIKEITCKDELYITISKLLEIKNINKINYYECTNINNKKRGDEPLFCASIVVLIPEILFHAVVDTSDKSVVINTVALLPHKIFKFGSEVLGNANSTSKVFNNTVDIFGDERTIIFLNCKNIFVRHRNHIGNGTIGISFIFFTSGGGFLLSRFRSNKFGAAAFIPFK